MGGVLLGNTYLCIRSRLINLSENILFCALGDYEHGEYPQWIHTLHPPSGRHSCLAPVTGQVNAPSLLLLIPLPLQHLHSLFA